MRRIHPAEWLQTTIARTRHFTGYTDWFPGTTSPVHVGAYERHFADSMIHRPDQAMQWWDGACWRTAQNGPADRHQVGDYPAWRGLLARFLAGQEVILLRGSRGRFTGPGCERQVRARLDSIDVCQLVRCTLLEDDPLATMAPIKTGESGCWHGLSFLQVGLAPCATEPAC